MFSECKLTDENELNAQANYTKQQKNTASNSGNNARFKLTDETAC